MVKRETNKIKAEKLDRLREIFADTYFVQLDSDRFEEIGEFTYKPLLQNNELADAIEFDEEMALAIDGESVNEIMKILTIQG